MSEDEDEKITENFFDFDEKKIVNGLNRLVLNIEKRHAKKVITIQSINFGVIVVTGSLFALLGNSLIEKLILVTPYALIGGKNLQTIDKQRYKIKYINHELESLKK